MVDSILTPRRLPNGDTTVDPSDWKPGKEKDNEETQNELKKHSFG